MAPTSSRGGLVLALLAYGLKRLAKSPFRAPPGHLRGVGIPPLDRGALLAGTARRTPHDARGVGVLELDWPPFLAHPL